MSLTPGYGETPVPDDELDALLADARELVGEPVTKNGIYDLEQALQNEVAERVLTSVLDATLTVADLLSDSFLRDLLRQYDRHRDPRELADFLGTQPLDL